MSKKEEKSRNKQMTEWFGWIYASELRVSGQQPGYAMCSQRVTSVRGREGLFQESDKGLELW